MDVRHGRAWKMIVGQVQAQEPCGVGDDPSWVLIVLDERMRRVCG
jgi:hypothetical protein